MLPAFSDANGDALSYGVSGLPPGLFFDGASRTIYGTPTTGGSYTINYEADDHRGGLIGTSFTLNVLYNNPPTAPSIPAQTAELNVAWSYLVPEFSDPNARTACTAIAADLIKGFGMR